MIRRQPTIARYLAERRLRDPSLGAVERLENSIAAAIEAFSFREAKRLLMYRLLLSEKLNDAKVEQEFFAQLSDDLEIAIADPEAAMERMQSAH